MPFCMHFYYKTFPISYYLSKHSLTTLQLFISIGGKNVLLKLFSHIIDEKMAFIASDIVKGRDCVQKSKWQAKKYTLHFPTQKQKIKRNFYSQKSKENSAQKWIFSPKKWRTFRKFLENWKIFPSRFPEKKATL